MGDKNSGDAESRNPKEQDEWLDQVVAKAVEAAAKGSNVDQLLEMLLATLPADMKDKVRRRFCAALAKRNLSQPGGKEADIASRGRLARVRDAIALSARQAFDRIAALVRSRPDVARRIEQAGKVLMMNGVIVDRVQVSEADLGAMAPTAGARVAQTQSTGRGA